MFRRRAVSASSLVMDIENLVSVPLSSIARPVLQCVAAQFTDNQTISDEFIRFLEQIPCRHATIDQIADRCAAVSFAKLLPLFDELKHALPTISLSLNEPIADADALSNGVLTRLTPLVDNSIHVRAVLFYLLDTVKLDMMLRILTKIDISTELPTKDSRERLFECCFSQFIIELRSPIIARIRLINARRWEQLMYIVSGIRPITGFSYLLEGLREAYVCGAQKTLLFKMFRSVRVEDLHARCFDIYQVGQAVFDQIELLQTDGMSKECANACVAFLVSFLSQLLIKFNGATGHTLVTMLLDFAQKKSVYSFSVLVAFFLYSNTVRKSLSIDSLIRSGKIFWSDSPHLVIDAFARILCGANFCVHYEEIRPDRFLISKMDSRDVRSIPSIFDIFMSKSATCGDCREEVTRFLIHLAMNDFKFFVGKCLMKLTQKTYLDVHAAAFFDAVLVILKTPLFTQSYKDEIMNFRSRVGDTIIFFLGEAERKQGKSYVFNVEYSNFDPSEILDTSEPQKVVLPTMRRFPSDVNKWKKAMVPIEDKDLTIFNSFPSPALQTATNLRILDTHIAHCLAVVPVLPYSENLVAVVLQFLSDEEVYLATIAAKAFVAIGIANQDKGQEMLHWLLNLDSIEENEQFYMRLHIALVFLKNVKIEVPEWLVEVVVIGLCSNSFEVRVAAFSLIDIIPHLNEFFAQKSKAISDAALAKLNRILTSSCDEKTVMTLPFRTVKDLASSNYEMLYHVFLSIVFTEEEDKKVVELFQKVRPAIVRYISRDVCNRGMTLLNLCTFVVGTATASEPSMMELNSIIMRAVKAVLEKGYSYFHVLFSFVSSLNQARVYSVIGMFTGPNEVYKRIFLATALSHWRKSDHEHKAKIVTSLFKQCEQIVMFFDALNYVSMTKVEPVQISMLQNSKNLVLSCLLDLTILTREICDFYAALHQAEPTGPFLRKPYVAEDIQGKNWLIFLFNLTQISSKGFSMLADSAKAGFASLCRVTAISAEQEDVIVHHIRKIANDNATAAARILSKSYPSMLRLFINEAVSEPQFLICIGKQFEKISSVSGAKDMLLKRMNRNPSEIDQQFFETTLSNLGQLLALSIYFLAGDKKGYESHALRILTNLIISAAVVKKSDAFVPLLQFLERRIDNGRISFRKIYHISRRVSTAFVFCAEPFLLQAMSIEYSHSFCCLLEPWFKNVRFSYNQPVVIQKCDQKCFNPYQFISLFCKTFCKSAVSPPVMDLICKFGDLELVFVLAFNLARTQKQESLIFLTYLCSANPCLIDLLSQLFSFRFWYFHMIQLSQYDRAFDIDAFLMDMKDSKRDESVVTKADLDVDAFEGLTSFALLLSLELMKISAVAKEKLRPYLLSFCWITKCEQSSYVLEQVLGSGNQSIESNIDIMSQSEKAVFAKNCFEWAASCGRIPMAYDAALMTICTINQSSPEAIDIILRSLKICVMALDEIEQWESKPRPKDFMKVHYLTDMSQFYGYIANLIRLLSKLNLMLKTPTLKVVTTICEFLKCHGSKEYTSIFLAAVDSLYDHAINSPKLIGVHDSSQGLLADVTMFDMILETLKDAEPLEKFFEVIFILVKAGSFDVLLRTESPKSAVSLAVLVLIPYCVGNTTRLEELAKASKILSIRSLVTTPIESVKNLLPNLTVFEMSVAIKFFTGMLAYLPELSSSVYSVSSQLLASENGRDLFNCASKMSLKALREREQSTSESACEFLSVYQHIGDVQTELDTPRKLQFPPIWVDSDFKVSDIDSAELPPLIPLDSNFNYLQIVNEMRQKGSAMEIEPFTHLFRRFCWSDATEIVCPNVTGVTWSPKDFDDFCALLMKSDAKKTMSRKTSVVTHSLDPESLCEKLLSIQSSVFLPPREEISSICPELGFPL